MKYVIFVKYLSPFHKNYTCTCNGFNDHTRQSWALVNISASTPTQLG